MALEMENVFMDHIGQNVGYFPIDFVLLGKEYSIYFVRENDDEIVVDICRKGSLLNPKRYRDKKVEGYINMRYFINMVLRNFESFLYLSEIESYGKNFDIEKRIPVFEKYRRASVITSD